MTKGEIVNEIVIDANMEFIDATNLLKMLKTQLMMLKALEDPRDGLEALVDVEKPMMPPA